MDHINTKATNSHNIKIAYIHATAFPSKEANTFDAIWTADALSKIVDITFFMPRIKASITRLKEYYEISDSHLKIQPMHLNLLPDRFLLHNQSSYEYFLSQLFRYLPQWSGFNGLKVLYVREPKELLYWGMNRRKNIWMKDWIYCYESHDTLGLDPNIFFEACTNRADYQLEAKQETTLTAAQNFDLMICNTQILADDMRTWSKGTLTPQVLALASPLPRASRPSRIKYGEKIIIGYIGTIDTLRGVDILLEAINFLPENYTLRIVGRFRKEQGVDPNWIHKYIANPDIQSRLDINLVDQINDVAGEIDRCDILVQPASTNIHDARYAAPLKAYSYMVRGKPIVAGDVLCHRELFNEGNDAILYQLTPEQLAARILELGNNPQLAEKIANGAWERGEYFSFERKIHDLLSMIENTSMGLSKSSNSVTP